MASLQKRNKYQIVIIVHHKSNKWFQQKKLFSLQTGQTLMAPVVRFLLLVIDHNPGYKSLGR